MQEEFEQDPFAGALAGLTNEGGAPVSRAFLSRPARIKSARCGWVTRSPIPRIPPPNSQCTSIVERAVPAQKLRG